MKKIIYLFLTFLFIDSVLYWGLWSTYFQQDEWFLFGRAIFQLQNIPFSLFNLASAHFWPLANILWIFQYKVFGFDHVYYVMFSLFSHVLVVTTSYYFFKGLIKKSKASFLLALLLLVSFSSRQVVVWFAVSYALPYAVFFVLLFFIYLFQLKKEKISKTNMVVLLSFFTTSLLFREEALVLIPLFPLYLLLFWRKAKIRFNSKQIGVVVFYMLILFLVRFLFSAFSSEHIQFEYDKNSVMTLYNILTSTPKLILQNIIEYNQVVEIAQKYTRLAFPRFLSDGLTIVTVIFELMIFYIFIPFTFIAGVAYGLGKSRDRKIMIFSLSLIFFYSVLLAPQTRRLIQMESRYLFFADIGVLLLLYAIFHVFHNARNKYVKTGSFLVAIVSVISFGVYSFIQIQGVLKNNYIPISQTRISIISQILKLYPTIQKNTVFYLNCKYEKDCKVNPLVVPFQSGVGHMLLVLYGSKNEKIYAPYFKEFYLWDWEAQGYKEIDGYGFGYYRQEDAILKDLKMGKFLPEEIIALSYDRSKNKIEDISRKFQNKLIKKIPPLK